MNKEYELITAEARRWQRQQMSRILAVTVIVLGLVGYACGQMSSARFHVGILVGHDDDAQSNIRSYVERELRSLRDVEVVTNSRPDFVLSIVGTRTHLTSGREMGFAFGVAVLEPKRCGEKNCLDYLTAFVYSGATDDLHRISEDIVTSFDTGILALRRKK